VQEIQRTNRASEKTISIRTSGFGELLVKEANHCDLAKQNEGIIENRI
jgi:hypothetical protein